MVGAPSPQWEIQERELGEMVLEREAAYWKPCWGPWTYVSHTGALLRPQEGKRRELSQVFYQPGLCQSLTDRWTDSIMKKETTSNSLCDLSKV